MDLVVFCACVRLGKPFGWRQRLFHCQHLTIIIKSVAAGQSIRFLIDGQCAGLVRRGPEIEIPHGAPDANELSCNSYLGVIKALVAVIVFQ